MKLHWITLFISSSLLLHTATAIPGLRYFRSSIDNVNRYRIRDTVPESDKHPDDIEDALPADSTSASPSAKLINRLKRPVDAAQGLVRPQKLRRANAPAEELSPATNVAANDKQASDIPSTVEPSAPQLLSSGNNVDTKRPTDGDLPSRQPAAAYIDNEADDNPAFANLEPMKDESQDPQNQVSQTALSRLRQFVSLTSVLANIARIPQSIAMQIDSVMAGLQTTYPTTTNVGAYMMGTRFLLRNQMALKPFELMDRAGLSRLDGLVSNMPSVFNPIFNSVERYVSELVRRIIAGIQRVREYVSTVSERARSAFSGMNVARGNDSYSLSVPNLIDLVLKGRLASAVDGTLGLLQRGLVSGLSGIGSSIAPSAVTNPIRNQQGYEMMRSGMRDYLRPARYYD